MCRASAAGPGCITQVAWWRRGEVWALDVDPTERRLATGSADSELRLYAIADSDTTGESLRMRVGVCLCATCAYMCCGRSHDSTW